MAKVLHLVVGHGLTSYFDNAIRSVLAHTDDPLLVIDNATPDPAWLDHLTDLAARENRVEITLRGDNNISRNAKVGGLYGAYRHAVHHAISNGFEILHIIQSDMQLLWWDDAVITRAEEIFAANPACVNILMQAHSRDALLGDELQFDDVQRCYQLRHFSLTDTGLYHLGRMQHFAVGFLESESEHSAAAAEKGLRVVSHPWGPVAPIPWPAVVRNGKEVGRPVRREFEFFLRPTDELLVKELQAGHRLAWLEDVAVPWGWSCLSPMWVSGLQSPDYIVRRVRAVRRFGLVGGLPRWETGGLSGRGLWRRLSCERRPALVALLWGAVVGLRRQRRAAKR